jgi:hypothetical protein
VNRSNILPSNFGRIEPQQQVLGAARMLQRRGHAITQALEAVLSGTLVVVLPHALPLPSSTVTGKASLSRTSAWPPDRRCAEGDYPRLGQELWHLLELVAGACKADLEPVDLAEPASLVRLVDAVLEVGDDRDQPRFLEWVGPEH